MLNTGMDGEIPLPDGEEMYMFGLAAVCWPPGKPRIEFALTKLFYEMWVKFCSMRLLLCATG
jgi:hypothetical protein